MTDYMQPRNPDWGILLPGPKDVEIRQAPRIDTVHEINPAYLSYWEVDATDRAMCFFFSALCGVIPSSIIAYMAVSKTVRERTMRPDEALDGFQIGVVMFCIFLPILAAFIAWLSTRLPFHPPVYFNRKLRKVYAWHGNKKIDGGWVSINWDKVVPVSRRAHLRQSLCYFYVLQLLEAHRPTGAIRKSILAFPSKDSPEACGEIWEYIRRYMDGAPENLPPARLAQDLPGWPGLVLRCHARMFGTLRRPDGSLDLLDLLLAPALAAATYLFTLLGVWLERIVPKQALPVELQQANLWRGSNPYRILQALPEEQARLKARAVKLLPIHALCLLSSLVFYSLVIWILIATVLV